MTYQLQYVDLDAGGVTVTVKYRAHRTGYSNRVQELARNGGASARRVGKNLPRHSVTFILKGDRGDMEDRLAYIIGVLQEHPQWVLKAPAGDYILNNWNEAAFVTANQDEAPTVHVGGGVIELTVQAIALGRPVSDGGSWAYLDELSYRFLDNDFFTATDDADYADGALYGVPLQWPGFPKVYDHTTRTWVKPPLVSVETALNSDGTPCLVYVYDLAGYVQGEPHQGGEGGPVKVLQFPDHDAIAALGTLQTVNVATLTNDFSITESSTGWLFGVPGGTTVTIRSSPGTATIALVSTEDALNSDGSAATVDVYEITGPDGRYIMELT